jgi:hypothetical protein
LQTSFELARQQQIGSEDTDCGRVDSYLLSSWRCNKALTYQVMEALIMTSSKLDLRQDSKTLALQTTFGSDYNRFLKMAMEQSVGSTEYNQGRNV